MSDVLTERLNKVLRRVTDDDFLSGSGIGNEVAFYIFDYPPEDELRVREHVAHLLEHIPRQKPGLRVKHVNLFEFVLDDPTSGHHLNQGLVSETPIPGAVFLFGSALAGLVGTNFLMKRRAHG